MSGRRGPALPGTIAASELDGPAVMGAKKVGPNRTRLAAGACSVCMLPNDTLLELNLLLADPAQWPRTIFEGIKLPRGALPPGYRMWGAIRMSQQYLAEHQLHVNNKALRAHYNRHVTQVAATASDFVDNAMRAESDSSKLIVGAAPVPTPLLYARYFGKGIELGSKALDMLLARINELEEKEQPVPLDLLLKAADIGTKLATSAAMLRARGLELEREEQDEMDGFRAGTMPLPSERMGHARIRQIEGVARPVSDSGRGDRRDYNKGARKEGLPTLPA